ncbi:uncharacterized protein HMPREF1541_04606 [Cyphellophora europaea CBS 101466]|uniref:R3H domain-containing protein n=1 Tax=Cyphellophora europaea (strain CBS 101466) TaxID=1220924 RepID=W2RVJ1_CYPE1|nr:uncharacterized protein HMPREF1541_04606 [Cyphellophora europaea CBS 101466]ETN40330.1 hypothetical protein HMPREF1541_04606 [Cyphellophora europaea CBS 101466]
MASPGVGAAAPAKLSFAKVAAMKAPAIPTAIVDNHRGERASGEGSTRRSTVVRDSSQLSASPGNPSSSLSDANEQSVQSNGTIGAIEGLSLFNKRPQQANGTSNGESGDSLEDDQSHLSTSSTKQHSFDTKSVASATTFAMDEKESLRPDDSASVRAVDDEDAGSTLGRNSTFSNEPDVLMPSLRGVVNRTGGHPITIASRRFQTLINPPRFGDLEATQDPPADLADISRSSPPAATQDDPTARQASVPAPPDERLLDALASPKDRLSILQLEERLLAFIRQSDVEFIDLPPQNSYARLLAHKLADYYGMMHHINEDGTSIRIFRAITISLPTSLAVLAKSIPAGSTQLPGPTAVKIMRRAGMSSRQMSAADSTAPSSSAPSKATSDAGHSEEGLTSPIEGTPGRDKTKKSREEREAQYKAARERIFGDFQEVSISENVSTGENSASMSRSSSSSGKKKSRRQKTPKDDSFEARSAFVPSYAPMTGMNVHGPYQSTQYVDSAAQNIYEPNQGFFGPQMNYGTTPTQAHPGFDPNMPTSPMGYGQESSAEWGAMQLSGFYGYQQNQPRPGYPAMNNMVQSMGNQYGQFSPAPQQQQTWPNTQFPVAYQPQMNVAGATGNWQGYQPYNYGQQMPNQPYPNSNAAMSGVAPISNNFNRSLFNPQTRSFVPNNSSSRAGSRNSSRKKNSTSSAGHGHGHGRNNTAVRPSSGTHSGALPSSPRGQDSLVDANVDATEESLQKKYGTPANLPKKPPPSQVPSHFDHASLSAVRNPGAPGISGRASSGGVPEGTSTS